MYDTWEVGILPKKIISIKNEFNLCFYSSKIQSGKRSKLPFDGAWGTHKVHKEGNLEFYI